MVRDIVFSVLAEYRLQPDPDGTDADLSDLEGQYIARGGAFDVVANADGEVVGSVGLYPVDASACELLVFCYLIVPSVGAILFADSIGKRLLEHALRRARELGFSRVTLETALVLEEAIRLYERYGFRRYQASHLSARCDAAYVLDLAGVSQRIGPS